jgi:predicted mannosyl-3-phosphoglycerate phosphatase (HAD superfamily)
VDSLLGSHNQPLFGFQEFCSALQQWKVPCVWLTSRTRPELEDTRRKLEIADPFIAEDGCGIYLPEDYFHVKAARTIRLGRYLCIPIASPQPASADALEELSLETGVAAVPLRSLSRRELAQNTGLPEREAERIRARDFDELFYFAGATDAHIAHFLRLGRHRGFVIRAHAALWSLAVGASLPACVLQLGQLYDKASHRRMLRIGITDSTADESLSRVCDRTLFLTTQTALPAMSAPSTSEVLVRERGQYSLMSPDLWNNLLRDLQSVI